MSSLLSSLMKKSAVTKTQVDTAKSNLVEEPKVELVNVAADKTDGLVGINAPEFGDASMEAVEIAETVEVPEPIEDVLMEEATDPMDTAYEMANEQSSKTISIPQHDDGLDDDEEELTSYHANESTVTFESDSFDAEDDDLDPPTQESVLDLTDRTPMELDDNDLTWNRKPFSSQYFNFSTRTVNALDREDLKCFDDIKGWAYSELKAIKGFGQGSLDELLELLEAENQSDWLSKRKRKSKSNDEVRNVEVDEEAPKAVVEVADEPTEVVEVVEVVEETAEVVEVVEPISENPNMRVVYEEEQRVEESDSCNDEVPSNEEAEGIQSQQESVQPSKAIKVLVIGNASPLSSTVSVASFEQVYSEAIREICQSASSPSLAMMEYGKGWQALSATIRQNGWPQGVDVLCVSKSFLSRSEILLELRLLADVVVEG
jgi:hypothetical protein